MTDRIYLNVDDNTLASLTKRLDLLAMSKGKRFRILRQVGQEVRRQARINLRQQKTIDNDRMTPRKKGRRKVLRKLGRNLTTNTRNDSVTVGYKNTFEGRIAYRHQYGITETCTATKMEKRYGRPDYNASATKKQAVALLKAGYRLYAGKTKSGTTKSRKPSVSWITSNLTMGYAGYMVRTLRKEKKQGRWDIKVPARPFLGVNEQQGIEILKKVLHAEINK